MPTTSRFRASMVAALMLVAVASAASALDLAAFEKNLTEHRLDNGLTFLIYERPGAPVVSFYTYVDVGSAQEVSGITGLAHMFEHMAFKGTSKIGTSDYEGEREAMAAVDEAYDAFQRERDERVGPDPDRLAELQQALEKAQDAARKYVVSNELDEIVSRAGGVGLNASTGSDATDYYYSLPANKVELWAHLESERFLDPVLREFYMERDVVMEERRLRVDSQPIGRLIEQFVSAAFIAHPYHNLGIGYMSDLQRFTREDAQRFYDTYYNPGNMTVAIVGAVKAEQVVPQLDLYFGRLPAGERTPPLRTREPEQIGERVVKVPDPSQPIYVEGYHRPEITHPDNAAYDALADVLSAGRTSRLYRSLVRDKKIAAQAFAFNGFPGSKYPTLMIFVAVTTPRSSLEDVQEGLREEIERIRTEPITDEELQKVKTRAKASLIMGLDSNGGVARQLASYQALFGDWRELFRSVDRIERLTKEDIMRVAQATFTSTNRTVGMIVTEDRIQEEKAK